MDVDEATPVEVAELMAKMKFTSECLVLTVCSREVSPGHSVSVALGRLSQAKNQYNEAIKQLKDLPDEATAEDKGEL